MSVYKDKAGKTIPPDNFSIDVKPKKNVDDCYSQEFVDANAKKLNDLKAKVKKRN